MWNVFVFKDKLVFVFVCRLSPSQKVEQQPLWHIDWHLRVAQALLQVTAKLAQQANFFVLFLGYRGIVHPPSDDGGTERTWFEPEHRRRKYFLSDQSKMKMFWLTAYIWEGEIFITRSKDNNLKEM